MHPLDSLAPYLLGVFVLLFVLTFTDSIIRWSVRKVRDEERRTREEGW